MPLWGKTNDTNVNDSNSPSVQSPLVKADSPHVPTPCASLNEEGDVDAASRQPPPVEDVKGFY